MRTSKYTFLTFNTFCASPPHTGRKENSGLIFNFFLCWCVISLSPGTPRGYFCVIFLAKLCDKKSINSNFFSTPQHYYRCPLSFWMVFRNIKALLPVESEDGTKFHRLEPSSTVQWTVEGENQEIKKSKKDDRQQSDWAGRRSRVKTVSWLTLRIP